MSRRSVLAPAGVDAIRGAMFRMLGRVGKLLIGARARVRRDRIQLAPEPAGSPLARCLLRWTCLDVAGA